MATRFHIGAKDLRGPITAYAKRFDLLEVSAPSAPATATMRRWRRQVPPHFDFCVVAGPALARLKPGEELDRDLEQAQAVVDALQARCLLLRTPVDVSPATVWRNRMAKVLERLRRDATHVVWEPSGLWELDDAALAAKQWGIVLSVDAARDPVPPGSVAYVRLRALGETRSYGEAALERVVAAVGPERRDAYVVIETDSALAEAKKLRSIAQHARAGAKGGLGRLVRPRGGIVVRDDEQE